MNNKENMINVALELFSKRGYSGVSVRDICGELGLKESALYYHFKNKEAILNTLYVRVDELVENMRYTFDNAFLLTTEVSTAEMQMVAKNFLQKYFCDEYVCKLLSMLSIERMSDEIADQRYQRLVYDMPLSQCSKIFTAMQERKIIEEVSPEYLAKEYLGIIYFAFDRYILGKKDKERGMVLACEEIEKNICMFYERITIRRKKQ